MSMGYLVNGVYKKKAGNASIENLPTATTQDPGLLSAEDKKKLDRLSEQTIASEETINSLFN